jgi:hypothetical protein
VLVAVIVWSAWLGLAAPSVSALQNAAVCEAMATPAVQIAATPAAAITTDLAFAVIYSRLAQGSADMATVALANLESEDLQSLAVDESALAAKDLAQVQSLVPDVEPYLASDPIPFLAVIESGKQQLDLPAGAGGTEGLGAEGAIASLCVSPEATDQTYVAAVLDLAAQKRDLALVEVVFGENSDLVSFAQTVLDRETTLIDTLAST